MTMEKKRVKESKIDNPGKYPNFNNIRQDFPAIKKVQAYLDTAYVGLVPVSVRAAHEVFLEERIQFGPFPTDSTILKTWLQKLEKVRGKLASFLGAKDKEIAFTYCTGCGANIALNGIDWRKGDNAVVDDLEYPTDVHILNALKKRGVDIKIAKSEYGAVSPDLFEALVDKRTRALVVSHISYLNGFRHDLRKLAELIHHRKGYLIVDGTQSIGAIRLDIKKEEVDFLSGAPYKWLIGPPGVGFFYIREDLIPLFTPDRLGWASTENFTLLETMESAPLPEHAKRYEYGTLNFEGIYALDAALDYINGIGIEFIEQHNLELIHLVREGLRKEKFRFYTPENNLAPILTVFIDNEKLFGQKMREKNVFVTARCWKEGQIRISPHFYNNEEDIDIFINMFSSILKEQPI
jgi:selenocysteine lyase/cysteine desulfurase